MPRFLPAAAVKRAQQGLSTSRAMTRLTDYLVFKRALVLSGGPGAQVTSGTRSAAYQQALSEWTLSGRSDNATKYFNPFESVLAKTGAYRTHKYSSNGPDNTWGGWQSALDPNPVVHVRGTANPKEYSFEEIPAGDLERQFLNAEDGVTKRPRLIDLAVWWLRNRDLEAEGIDETSSTQALVDLVVQEGGLTPREVAVLFDSDDQNLDPR